MRKAATGWRRRISLFQVLPTLQPPSIHVKGLDTEPVLPILEDPSILGHPQLLPLRYFKAVPCHSSLKTRWVLGVVALGKHGEQELCSPNYNATITL